MSDDRLGKYVRFDRVRALETGVTQRWTVRTLEGGLLGYVKWFGRWRCYGFFPDPDCVFERVCLRDIADFVEDLTNEHRRQRKSVA